tara:strand:- start:11 stop:553 length:543 start_codon:yes stop_codon:yes gene_type:complete
MFNIVDDFLDIDKFNHINSVVNNPQNFNWSIWSKANKDSKEGDWHAAHMIINLGEIISPTYKYIADYLVESLHKIYKKNIGITKLRVNLFVRKDNSDGLGYHKDIKDSDDWTSLLLYLEDSNGKTEFKNVQNHNGMKIKSVESIANRALIFPAHYEHQTVMQTDILFRKNINMNFKFYDN